MKKILNLGWMALALLAMPLAKTAIAEDAGTGPCRDALQEVQKTQAVMERAAPVIRNCASDTAKALFARALRAQTEAREALRNRNCRAALELTIRARRLTFAALKLCGKGDNDAGLEPAPEN